MLDWLFSSQFHKNQNGFFLNHDNLMIATPCQRRKLIFYFIATQTPEKLDPQDRAIFTDEKYGQLVGKANLCSGLLGFSVATFLPYVYSKINRRFGLNLVLGLGMASFAFYFGQNLVFTVWEPKFVATNQVVDDLSKKYNFTIFDFHQAKKESHLKALRRELVSDSPITGY